jgi:hypothetical protein
MRPSLTLELPDPEWLTLLRAQREEGKSVSQIARETGMKRPSVSMLLNGTYPAKSLNLVTRKHGARIVQLYRNKVACPHQRVSISNEECRRLAGAPMSTSHPDKLAQWGACRKCDLNPLKGEADERTS